MTTCLHPAPTAYTSVMPAATRTRKMRPEFYALHAATLNPNTTPTDLAAAITASEGVQERHRLSEGAVYATALRRYLLDTGTAWRSVGVTPATTTWGGQSAHRARLTADTWACSCGARGHATDPAAGHATHRGTVEHP